MRDTTPTAAAARRRVALLCAAAGLLAAAGPPAAAGACFEKSEAITVRGDETRTGDVYFAGSNVDIAGVLDGDLSGVAGQIAVISGTVNGDINVMGQSLDIQGTVNDTVRTLINNLSVSGTIDGDVVGFGLVINVHPRGRITGGLYAVGQSLVMEGTIDGPVRYTGGKVSLSGTIRGDVHLEADTIEFQEGARIEGNLEYESRRPVEADLSAIVGGEVVFTEKKDDEEDEIEAFLTAGDVLWWSWWTAGSLVVALIAVAVMRPRTAPRLVAPLREEPVLGVLIGLGAFLVTLAAAVLSIVLIVTIPLGILTLLLFLAAVYLAKVPVALWLGSLLLRPVGRGRTVSPYLAVAVGIVVVHLLFEVPWIGWLLWLATVFGGLGAAILAVRARLTPAETTAPAD